LQDLPQVQFGALEGWDTEMTTTQGAKEVPKCPHCGAELASISLFSWLVPGFVVLGTFCPDTNCRVLLHTQVVPAELVPQGLPQKVQ